MKNIENTEIWKDIPNYEGKYQVSNLGNVKSLNYHRSGKERLMNTVLTGIKKRQYKALTLYSNNKGKTEKVHQLVAMSFLGFSKNKNGIIVDHINNDPLDNRLENLQVITQRENNSKDVKCTSSIFTGVCYHKKAGKWESYITINKKRKHIGLFKSEIEASNEYKKALELFKNNDLSFLDISNKTSKYKGVHFDKHRNRWSAEIRINSIKKRIGRFKTELEAYNALELYKKENYVNI
jgi:hypothetical protein